MSWGPDSFLALLKGAQIGDAVRFVRELSDDDRRAAAKGLGKALPHVVALGSRKGSSKVIRVARLVTDGVQRRPVVGVQGQ